ncbi:MAG: shikimate kinase [Clostridiales bacterium]|nr:shikimate kinase [Clostridiales bacterium]
MADYGLIGEKLGHSFSAAIHNQFGYDYELRELPPSELESFMSNPPFLGFNVTIPYKQAVMPYLDEIHPYAAEIGAVNTVVVKNGKRCGYNTDFAGMKFALDEYGIRIDGKDVLILGSGGTAHTATALVKSLNAKRVRTVSRTGALNYENLPTEGKDAQIIINTTPVGMYPHSDGCPVDLSWFPQLQGVFDAVYNPLTTRLVSHAKARGIAAGNGLLMLVAQAKFARDLFLGTPCDDGVIHDILRKLEFDKQNIVLVGMSGCGKTTIGKLLAERLTKTFVDTDEQLIKIFGKSIPQVFQENGEQAFRAAERDVVEDISKRNGLVIATGGGAPLSEVSRERLKQNAVTVYLTRNVQSLDRTGRPLAVSEQRVSEMLAVRDPVYRDMSDFVVSNDSTPQDTAERIIEELQI